MFVVVSAPPLPTLSQAADTSLYCTLCLKPCVPLVSQYVECAQCGAVCHHACAVQCDRGEVECKRLLADPAPEPEPAPASAPASPAAAAWAQHHHQWMRGNLGMGSTCAVCDGSCESCMYDPAGGVRCLWCRTTVHLACVGRLPRGDACTPPELLARVALPPSCFRVRPPPLEGVASAGGDNGRSAGVAGGGGGWLRAAPAKASSTARRVVAAARGRLARAMGGLRRGGRPGRGGSGGGGGGAPTRTVVQWEEVECVGSRVPPGATPVVVMVNQRSGGLLGAQLLKHFRRVLHPLQVPCHVKWLCLLLWLCVRVCVRAWGGGAVWVCTGVAVCAGVVGELLL